MEGLSDEVTVSLLGDRQLTATWGFQGGKAGAPGQYSFLRKDDLAKNLASKSTTRMRRGDVLSVSTPGGGGYGPPNRRAAQLEKSDGLDGKL